MDIDWVDSTHPSVVVGIAPDGGLLVHASLHPLGAEAACGCAMHAGVMGSQYAGEVYFPMPWIRSELASVLKHKPARASASFVARICTALYETLPTLQTRAVDPSCGQASG